MYVHVPQAFCWYTSSVLYTYLVLLFAAGFVSNGEFNYLKSKGYTRPLSILQICTDVHNMNSHFKESVLLNLLSQVGMCVH